jgi:hypothetical protein
MYGSLATYYTPPRSNILVSVYGNIMKALDPTAAGHLALSRLLIRDVWLQLHTAVTLATAAAVAAACTTTPSYSMSTPYTK